MHRLSRRELLEILGGTVGTALVGAAIPPSVGEPDVRVEESADSLSIDNGLIKASFRKAGGGIEQEYSARADGQWTAIVNSLRPPRPRPSGCAPLYSDQQVANEYRLLATEGLHEFRVTQKSDAEVRGELRGAIGANAIEQTVTLRQGQKHAHVEVRAVLAGTPPRLEYLLSTFAFAGGTEPDFTHVPCVKRAPDDIVADQIFDAPATIVQKGGLQAALVPDLDLLNQEVVYAKGARPLEGTRGFRVPVDPARISMPAIMDLDLKSGLTPNAVFAFGWADFITEQHMYWRHENKNGAMVRELSSNNVHYGFDLFVSADAPPFTGYQPISRHLWQRYGSHYFAKPRPQVMPFSEYAKVCFPAAFAYKGDIEKDTKHYAEKKPYDLNDSGPLPTWLEFELDAKPCGGIRATPAQWYYDIQFSPWWNNAHDAVGMYWWGKRGDATLIDKARRMVNLALAAPQQEGVFPSIYNYKDKRWVGCYWKPTDANIHWQFPTTWQPKQIPRTFWDFHSDYYQTSAASKTAVYLLRYTQRCEDDPRIFPFVRAYGDFIVAHLDSSGCLPAWFTAKLEPVRALRFNAEGGIHIWLLAELHAATGEQKYLDAAQRMAEFLQKEILPKQRWYDFETFYSCSIKPEDFYDSFTGQWPQNTLSMQWAMDGLASLYQATHDAQHLRLAESVADFAGFYQAVWQPHYIITAYAFGGYRSQNSDAEWLDMRQTVFGEAYMRLGLLTGRQDFLERGVATLRASFAIINHPRNIQNDVFRYPALPVRNRAGEHRPRRASAGSAALGVRLGRGWRPGVGGRHDGTPGRRLCGF